MKAVTKLQKRVVELSDKKLPKLTDKQNEYALKHNLDHVAVVLKSGRITCLDCGHSWQSKFKQGWHNEIIGDSCPNCKVKLDIKLTQKRKSSDWSYMHIITTCEEFQVIRLIKVMGHYNSGHKASLYVSPVSEIWMAPNGKYEIVGFNHRNTYYGAGGWWSGDWSLKARNHLDSQNLYSYKTYPVKRVTKLIKRNGFKGSFHKCKPYAFFKAILEVQECETLLKTKQKSLLEDGIKSYQGLRNIRKHWSEIKICIRNNYIVKDATIWHDYLDLCAYFEIDTHKAEIACSPNMKAEHDRMMNEKQFILDEDRRLREIADHQKALKLRRAQKAFFKKITKKFSEVLFKDKDIVITAFKTENQLKEESLLLKHCAYAQKYHLKLDSLLLSATYKGKPVETIQVCLKKFELIQARGYDNDPSKHNKRIINLVIRNMTQIRNVVKSKPIKKPKTQKQAA